MQRDASTCARCGAAFQEYDSFCGQCGTPIADKISKDKVFDASEKEADVRVRETDSRRPLSEDFDATEDTTEADLISSAPANPKSRKGRILCIVLAVLLLIVAGLFALTHFYVIDLDQGLVSKIMQRPQPQKVENIPPAPPSQPQENQIRTPADLKERIENALTSKDFSLAEKHLRTALERYPGDPDLLMLQARYFLGCVDCGSPDFRKNAALQAAAKALEIMPTDQNSVNVGWIYQEFIQDCRSALDYYERGVSWGNSHPELFYYMGICYQNQGLRDLAKDHFRQYLEMVPEGKFASEARHRIARF